MRSCAGNRGGKNVSWAADIWISLWLCMANNRDWHIQTGIGKVGSTVLGNICVDTKSNVASTIHLYCVCARISMMASVSTCTDRGSLATRVPTAHTGDAPNCSPRPGIVVTAGFEPRRHKGCLAPPSTSYHCTVSCGWNDIQVHVLISRPD